MAVVVGSLVRYKAWHKADEPCDIGVVTGFVTRGPGSNDGFHQTRATTYAVVYYSEEYPDEEERAEDLETVEVLNESR